MSPHYDLAADWRKAAGRLTLCAYLLAAAGFDWRPADVLEPWLSRPAEAAINLIGLCVAYRSARKIGARYGRWREATAVPGTLPTRTRKDLTRG